MHVRFVAQGFALRSARRRTGAGLRLHREDRASGAYLQGAHQARRAHGIPRACAATTRIRNTATSTTARRASRSASGRDRRRPMSGSPPAWRLTMCCHFGESRAGSRRPAVGTAPRNLPRLTPTRRVHCATACESSTCPLLSPAVPAISRPVPVTSKYSRTDRHTRLALTCRLQQGILVTELYVPQCFD